MKRAFLLVCALSIGCSTPEADPKPESAPAPVNEPRVSRPIKQGFTQRPAPDTPGLPPPIAPLLSPEEAAAAEARAVEIPPRALVEAQDALRAFVAAYAREPSGERLAALREKATDLAGRGLIPYLAVETLYAAYLFPNDTEAADGRFKDKLVVLEGTVAPLNMKDMADGFKLFEQEPYVHDPLLLATDYELSFVECRLARPEAQPLRDWQPIHFVAEVEGKRRSDVVLRRCVVI